MSQQKQERCRVDHFRRMGGASWHFRRNSEVSTHENSSADESASLSAVAFRDQPGHFCRVARRTLPPSTRDGGSRPTSRRFAAGLPDPLAFPTRRAIPTRTRPDSPRLGRLGLRLRLGRGASPCRCVDPRTLSLENRAGVRADLPSHKQKAPAHPTTGGGRGVVDGN